MSDQIKITSTKDPSVAKDCNGFIAPNGDFYIISNKSSHKPTHDDWASNFVCKQTDYLKDIQNTTSSLVYTISKLKDKQDILMYIYGYVYFSYSGEHSTEPVIIFPDEKINDRKVTVEQKNMLFDIAKLSGEDKVYYFDYDDSIREKKHSSYVQRYISRRVEEEIKNDE